MVSTNGVRATKRATKTVPSTPQPGRRQAHKQRTELALQKAALELFAKNGYDTTTTDEIAEQAGVSPRTFFRYFPTKESVLFAGEYGWFQSFTELFLAQPDSLTDVEAVRDTLVALAPQLSKIRRALLLLERAVASSPMLRGGVHDRHEEDVATLADAIARRRGLASADEPALLLASICLVVYRRSITQWLEGPANAEPHAVVARQFELLDDLFAPTGARPRKRPAAAGGRSRRT